MSTRQVQSRSKVYTNTAKEADCTNKEREEGDGEEEDGEEEDQESEAEEGDGEDEAEEEPQRGEATRCTC